MEIYKVLMLIPALLIILIFVVCILIVLLYDRQKTSKMRNDSTNSTKQTYHTYQYHGQIMKLIARDDQRSARVVFLLDNQKELEAAIPSCDFYRFLEGISGMIYMKDDEFVRFEEDMNV